ncbi:MAG: N-ethylmaleimide reductase, partial [Kiritimatiellia bacterium]
MPPAPPTLFTPFGSLGLRNRSVMAPMTRYACTSDGNPTNEVKAYYRRRAENELSLIIVESSAVNDGDGMGYLNGARFHTAEHVREWKKVVDDVHAAGAKIWIQLFHPGRLTVEAITGGKVLAPSATPAFDGPSFWRPEVDGKTVSFQTQTPFETPVAMSLAEIETVTSQFAHSCRLAVEAGFDGVEIHGAHGYLLHQFCHSEVNERTDAFSPSAQFAFIGQVVQACREALGPEPTLSYRLSVHMVDNTFIRYDPEAFDHTQLV